MVEVTSISPPLEGTPETPLARPGRDGYVEFPAGRDIGPVGFKGRWGLQRVHTTMEELAQFLARQMGSVVVNFTGLSGKYSLGLRWSTLNSAPSLNSQDLLEFSDPPLSIAIRQQLGLVLRQSKGPSEVIVIDSMDREATTN